MEKIAPPLPPMEREVRWASHAIFFLALGLGDYLHLGTPGTCSRRLQALGVSGWSVQSKGLVHWRQSILISCMPLARMDRHTRNAHGPHHHHHRKKKQEEEEKEREMKEKEAQQVKQEQLLARQRAATRELDTLGPVRAPLGPGERQG